MSMSNDASAAIAFGFAPSSNRLRAVSYVVTTTCASLSSASSNSLADPAMVRNPNFVVISSSHCGSSNFGASTSVRVTRFRAMSSERMSPAEIVLPNPTSSASKVTGSLRQNVMRFCTWCAYGCTRSRQDAVERKSSALSMTIGSARSHSCAATWRSQCSALVAGRSSCSSVRAYCGLGSGIEINNSYSPNTSRKNASDPW